LRTSVILLVNFLFWVFLFDFHVRLLLSYRKRHGKIGFGNMWRVVKLLYAPKGIFFSIIGEWLDYFRPGF
ncbi:hypothetical protein, partial [Klebsiella pneumoniae]|uniref:hypothetical protein n=1 Tax=Klebsiella pneumoniae TaxID=573 RepID=UPI00256EFA2B